MLEVHNLTKSYGDKEVLRGVNFTVNQGETVVIMGPSGCGKSTTIHSLNLLTRPDDGEIIFKGKRLLELSASEILKVREEIGFVFQNFNLISRLTVLENVMLPLINRDLSVEEMKSRALVSLKRVRLDKEAYSYPSNLSGGQKQRVGIARALVIEPDLILLDEPTASLDPILVREVLEVVEELAKDNNRGIVIVTHEVSFALKVADIILLMDRGRIVEEGSADTIFINPKSEVGRKYKKLIDYY